MFKHVICSNKTTYLVALSWTYHFKAFSLFPPATPAANFAEEVPPEDSASSCRQGCIPGPSSVRNLAVQKKKGYSPLLTYSPYAKNGAGISGILVNIPYMEHMGSTVCVSGACKLTFGSVSHEFSCSSTTGMGQNWVPQGPKVGQFRTGQSNCGRLHRRLTQRLSFMWLKQSWTIPQSSPFL